MMEGKMGLALLATAFCAAFFSPALGSKAGVPAIYVFGDSGADVGNNNYLPGEQGKANFPHNGIDYPDGKPTGRSSNGYNFVNLLGKYITVRCREMADFTVSKFKKVISLLNRTGHARFRRGPTAAHFSAAPASAGGAPVASSAPFSSPAPSFLNAVPAPPLAQSTPAAPQPLTLDFTKPIPRAAKGGEGTVTSQFSKDSFSISPPMSSTSSSFMSSITGDGSVSNGKHGSSILVTPVAAAVPSATMSAGKPPLSSSFKKKCHAHSDISGEYSVSGGRCHCSKRRKSPLTRTIRVPAISSKIADIPPDEYSWRKYGQKPIKGSPYPRGFYKCSIMRGCPARKHVERDPNDPSMLIVTYEGEHRHIQNTADDGINPLDIVPAGNLMFESS